VGQAGIAAAQVFATEWEKCKMDLRLQDEAVFRHGEDAAVEALPEQGDIPAELLRAPVAHPEKARKEEHGGALQERSNKRPAATADGAGDTPPQRKRPARPIEVPPAQRAPMKFELKQQLSVALASLPIHRQAGVVQIITDTMNTQDDEIEINLDTMDNITVWRLFDYVFPRSQQVAMGVIHNDHAAKAQPATAPPEHSREPQLPEPARLAPPPPPVAKPAAPSAPPVAKPPPQRAPMSTEQKRQLAGLLAALPAHGEQARVVRIFSGLRLGAGNVHLNALESSMLWKLYDYVLPADTL